MQPPAASLQDPTPWSAACYTQRNRGRFRANCMTAIGLVSAALLVLLLPSQTNYALAHPEESSKNASLPLPPYIFDSLALWYITDVPTLNGRRHVFFAHFLVGTIGFSDQHPRSFADCCWEKTLSHLIIL
eukprot:GHVT01084275.1.p1 GENE.GHVT01084275.1~~GHVT01084275.1.p1  ORF type:complete len:130 (+),score=13.43 GHVT01084275.1:2-391(+)